MKSVGAITKKIEIIVDHYLNVSFERHVVLVCLGLVAGEFTLCDK